MTIKRLALVSDTWRPQVNGVANTLVRLVGYLESQGVEVLVVAPSSHKTIPMPSYPEIRIARDPWKALGRIRAFAPEAVHIATEGPLGFWTCSWMRRRGLRFTSSFHTRFPEYLSARLPVVPLSVGYGIERWFHSAAEHTLVGTMSLLRELETRRIGRRLIHWPRGVDTDLFNPSRRRDDVFAGLPRPIWLYVGRVAIEKSVEDFLTLKLPGSKVVVGDGPSRAELERRFPDAIWRGYRFGEELATHFASADCFVFPSKTETFGNVILEAMASGLPTAAVPAPGPTDLISDGVNGAISTDLADACARAIGCARERVRASALPYTFRASHERFRSALVPMALPGVPRRRTTEETLPLVQPYHADAAAAVEAAAV